MSLAQDAARLDEIADKVDDLVNQAIEIGDRGPFADEVLLAAHGAYRTASAWRGVARQMTERESERRHAAEGARE